MATKKRLQMLIEFDIDVDTYYRADDPEEVDWFYNYILCKDLILHSNELGDSIANPVHVIKVTDVTNQEKVLGQ